MNGVEGYTDEFDWKKSHASRLATPEEAVSRIKAGQRVFLGTGAAVPQTLVRALVEQRRRLADVEIVHLFTLGEAPYANREWQEIFNTNTFFVAENVRAAVQGGWGDYTPLLLSDIPRLFAGGHMPLDVAMIQVTPPDQEGVVSLGVSVDVVRAALENAALVIAQVNPFMPRTRGESLLHVWEIDLLVEAAEPLPEMVWAAPGPVLQQIGRHLASLVDDGSTLQIGIGRAPQSVLPFLAGKKDLGIHTEMLTDSVIELVEAGRIPGTRKTHDPEEIVCSFAMGSRRLYDFLHENPLFSFRRTEYVNDPGLILRQQRMVAINTALQVDLTGQVCVDSLGPRIHSGMGGVVNFNYGASHAPEGKAIIVLPSTARNGKVSRIVEILTPGAGVAIHRGCVHYVVSEFGVAYLFGKSLQERAIALIGIAHPDFRARLLKRAIRLGLLRAEMSEVEGRILVGPQELKTSLVLQDGTLVTFRPAHPGDRKAIKETLYSLSEASIYKRFMATLKRFPFQRIKNFIFIDHRRDVVMVGTVPEENGEIIVAIGGYYLDPEANRAEVAFLVRDAWQGRGIGTFLMKHLATVARRNGIQGLRAETLRDNQSMQAVLAKCGWPTTRQVEEDIMVFNIELLSVGSD
ncbi:MAG: GNAT family N-acetyltransferase [Magnetococcales bacterium]|nr:GNAT family N-acetyltransferase [Magnetococcales bacterium]